jgi:hypothetical protein
MTVLLKRDADDKELRDAASLEAYTTHEVLVKGKVVKERRRFFMLELASAAKAIAETLKPPARTRKPKKRNAG